jgi:hypothetical protein
VNTVQTWADQVIGTVESVFLGKRPMIEKMLVAVLCRGHVLLENVPGVGKTILARTLAQSLGGVFSRVQCTPDLLPADIVGVSIYKLIVNVIGRDCSQPPSVPPSLEATLRNTAARSASAGRRFQVPRAREE